MNANTELNGEWKPSPIFPQHYLVSTNGEVFSLRSHKIIKAFKDTAGYYSYALFVNGERRNVTAHRLVAMAFIPNPLGKPAVDHIDTDKENNHVSNLKWVTYRENARNPKTYERLAAIGKIKIQSMNVKRAKTRLKKVIVRWADGTERLFPSVKDAAAAIGMSYPYLVCVLKSTGVTHNCHVRYAQ